MKQIKELLDSLPQQSNLRRVLECQLIGLKAALHHALADEEEPSHRQQCEDFMTQLNALLTSAAMVDGPADDGVVSAPASKLATGEDTQPSPPDARTTLAKKQGSASRSHIERDAETEYVSRLSDLCDRFQQDSPIVYRLGTVEFAGTSDDALWNELQRFLLRLPRTLFKNWDTKITEHILKSGACYDKQNVLFLYGRSQEIIYPGLAGSIQTQGLGLSPEAQSLAEIQPNQKALDRHELETLAEAVNLCLHFAIADRNITHCLENLNQFLPKPPQPDTEKQRYMAALLDRFKQIQRSNKDELCSFAPLLNLAEAIFSLVYIPPADPKSSWWYGMQKKVFSVLQTLAQECRTHDVEIRLQWLADRYEDVQERCEGSLSITSGYESKKVAACLRPFATIQKPGGLQSQQGRVIYQR